MAVCRDVDSRSAEQKALERFPVRVHEKDF